MAENLVFSDDKVLFFRVFQACIFIDYYHPFLPFDCIYVCDFVRKLKYRYLCILNKYIKTLLINNCLFQHIQK